MNRLAQIFWDLQMEDPVGLEEFCEAARGGRYGAASPEEIGEFLGEVEQAILENIELKLAESPHLAPLRQAKIDETQAMIADLLRRYGAAGA
ncbi:MAG: hypothetical protein ACREJI_07465 [Candidatus Methylomirabilales bacterium]